MKDTFVVYTSYLEKFSRLSDEQMGILFRAMMEYQASGEIPSIDDIAVSVCFDVVKCDIDANNAKYDAIVKRNQENGKRGGRPKTEANPSEPKEPTGFFGNPSKPKKADNDSDSDNDTDNDYEPVYITDVKREDANASKRKTVDELIQRWNGYEDRGSIPTVRSVTTGSKVWKSIFARIDDVGIDKVNEVMDMVFESDYLRGMKTDWCAKFDWVFLPSNFDKIQNGNYRNMKQAPQGLHSSQERGGYEAMLEMRRVAEARRAER